MRHLKLYEEYKNINKIIFLDIDGVLNIIYEESGFDEYGSLFKSDCIDNLKNIINSTGAKIVISSTWKDSGLSIMKEMWNNRNLPGEVIDITPNPQDVVDNGIEKWYDLVSRGQEIELWIKLNNFKGNYIIIDDNNDFINYQQSYFIKTNPIIGLTNKDVEKSINILNK